MVNIWLIRPGEEARLWDEFKDNKCIAIGWDDESYTGYQSLADVKQQHGYNNANSIWYFYKHMKIGDIAIAIKGQKNVLGIGKITSDYIEPKDSENPGIEYGHVRFVDWLIVDKLEDISYNLPQKTITPVKENWKWEEIGQKYVYKDPKYKEIFDALQIDANITSASAQDQYLNEPSILDNTLSHTKNVILYGPPGTGKTYAAQQFINSFLADQLSTPKSFDEIKMEYLQDLTWYQITALAMYLKGKNEKIKVADLKNDELLTFYFERVKVNAKSLTEGLGATLQIYSNPNSETIKYGYRNSPTLFDKTDKSEWYLLPDGIDYVETSLSDIKDIFEGRKKVSEDKKIEDFCTFVTFHQSYGYEDFIEGLKPVVNDDADVSYKVEAGVFKEICERARYDLNNKYVLVIDEINRGNIAKIFGELITLIEDDKRSGNDNAISTKLPYSKTNLSVPSNLYIIGTMNTADRSIALLDIALRRRFTFLEIMPEYSIIDVEVGGVNIASLLEGLNIMVSALIDRDHQIGHSYFCEIVRLEDEEQAKEKLYFVWYKKIIPLLQEYFYNDWEQLKDVLGDFVVENNSNKIPALKDKLVNKTYEIRDFENDWDSFSMALNKICNAGNEIQSDKEE